MQNIESGFWYMDILVDYRRQTLQGSKLTKDIVMHTMTLGVTKMFGERISSLPLDILKYEEEERSLIIRVPEETYAKVRAALTCIDIIKMEGLNIPVAFTVRQASSCLLSLAGPERQILCC